MYKMPWDTEKGIVESDLLVRVFEGLCDWMTAMLL